MSYSVSKFDGGVYIDSNWNLLGLNWKKKLYLGGLFQNG